MEQDATQQTNPTLSIGEITKKEIMGGYPKRPHRNKNRKDSNKLPPFVPLTWDILNSPGFIKLPPSAGKALPYFLGKVKMKFNDPQRYLMEFPFSYTEAQRFGFANATHNRIISELISKGFIDPVDKGGLRGTGLSYNLFRLSERWREYGTKDFRHAENWDSFMPQRKNKRNIKNGNL